MVFELSKLYLEKDGTRNHPWAASARELRLKLEQVLKNPEVNLDRQALPPPSR